MQESIKKFLEEYYDLISEELKYAARESIFISEHGENRGMVSLVLTTNFKLKTIQHVQSSDISDDIIYVLYSFENETYLVDFEDVMNFLTSEQRKAFEMDLLKNASEIMKLSSEDLEEFKEASNEEKLYSISHYLYENYMILDCFEQFSGKLYEDYRNQILEEAISDLAIDNMMDHVIEGVYIIEE